MNVILITVMLELKFMMNRIFLCNIKKHDAQCIEGGTKTTKWKQISKIVVKVAKSGILLSFLTGLSMRTRHTKILNNGIKFSCR